MKKMFITLSIITLSLTGCSAINLNEKKIDEVIDSVLIKNTKLKNSNFEGYSYYIPRELNFINKNDYNAVLKDSHNNYYYLYVDVVSYYHKVEKNYKVDNSAYYSKKLKNKKKYGYFEINEEENGYFIEAMYNYMKVETFVKKNDLNDAIVDVSMILSSIKYNNKVLDTIVGENVLSYKEEKFNIFKTKKDTTDFLDYINEYENIDEEELDEDNLKIKEEE